MKRFLWTHRFAMAGFLVLVSAACLFSAGCGSDGRFLPVYLDQDLQGFGGVSSSSPTQPVLTHTPAHPTGRP